MLLGGTAAGGMNGGGWGRVLASGPVRGKEHGCTSGGVRRKPTKRPGAEPEDDGFRHHSIAVHRLNGANPQLRDVPYPGFSLVHVRPVSRPACQRRAPGLPVRRPPPSQPPAAVTSTHATAPVASPLPQTLLAQPRAASVPTGRQRLPRRRRPHPFFIPGVTHRWRAGVRHAMRALRRRAGQPPAGPRPRHRERAGRAPKHDREAARSGRRASPHRRVR